MTEKAVVFTPDDTILVAEFELDNAYDFLSSTVGGYIEAVALADEITGYVNEEGKLQSPPLPPNGLASIVARLNGGIELQGDYIAGNMVVVGVNDEGDTVGLSDELIEQMLMILAD